MIICYFGDSITLGYGDPSGLGWPGRVSGRLATLGVDVTSYNLGVRKDASTVLVNRWQQEAELRKMDGMDHKLVFSFGVADVLTGQSMEESLAAAEDILTKARTMGDVLLIGPTPVSEDAKSEAIEALSSKLSGLCERLDVPFLPVIEAMRESDTYRQALEAGDTIHPALPGYAVLADCILQSETTRDFFGIE